MNRILTGALAGALATIPMSWAMEVMHRLLPEEEQHPLPPRLITDRLLEKAGARLSESQRVWLSLGNHLAYGAAAGAVYQTVADRVTMPPMAKGTIYALALWFGSYLGGLPGLGILKNPAKHPARRNALMIVSHLVYGSALAVFQDLFQPARDRNHPGFLAAPTGPRAAFNRFREKHYG